MLLVICGDHIRDPCAIPRDRAASTAQFARLDGIAQHNLMESAVADIARHRVCHEEHRGVIAASDCGEPRNVRLFATAVGSGDLRVHSRREPRRQDEAEREARAIAHGISSASP